MDVDVCRCNNCEAVHIICPPESHCNTGVKSQKNVRYCSDEDYAAEVELLSGTLDLSKLSGRHHEPL